jgi:uncharacterized membrane protein
MWFIILCGLIMIAVSLVIIFKPVTFSFRTIQFSHKPWFHPFEIISRILIGIGFIHYAEQTSYPIMFSYLGYLILGVGIGLIFLPANLHRKFARYSATKVHWLKIPAVLGVAFGCFMIYAVI